ncbi:MAG: HD domain-containing protein [Desulfobacterales bacterium]|nr:HD domain-containing protein [Desulfobacterales bacterium]
MSQKATYKELEELIKERTAELAKANKQLRLEIIERKLAEEKTRSANAELNQIVDAISGGICLIDKNFNVLKANQGILTLCGISIDETTGKKCYETFSSDLCNTPECILTKILSGEEHIEMEMEKKCINGKTIPCILSATPFRAHDGELIGIVEHLTDITLRKKYENELKDSLRGLRKSLRGTIRAMALTVETRDPYTSGHQQRVADLARSIAKEMGFSRDKITGIRMAGALHDIGKIAIPVEILSKPGQLNGMEFELIRDHPQIGYNILKSIKFPWPVAKIVLQHHERMDGSGYPQGLSGEGILLEARILGVADVVEAMTSNRPYRAALGIDKGLEEISINRGKLYDIKVVDTCLKLFKENKFKFKI